MPPLSNFQKSCIAVAVGQALVSNPAHAATIVVDGLDPVTNCTLLDAVASANTDMAMGNCTQGDGPDTIQMHDVQVTFDSPNFGSNALLVTSDITIEGKSDAAATGGGLIARDTDVATPDFRLISVSNGSLTLKDIAVTDGRLSAGGEQDGAGIRVNSGTLILRNSALTRNIADGNGGGIYASNTSQVRLYSSNILNNSATNGAGLDVRSSATLYAATSNFSSNSASAVGGALRNTSNGNVTIYNSRFSNNMAYGNGGGIYSSGNSVEVTGGEFSGNFSENSGGAFAAQAGLLTISDTTISRNSALVDGAGISIRGSSSLSLNRSSIARNNVLDNKYGPNTDAAGVGGGLLFSSTSTSTINNSTISGNIAAQGGGIYITAGSLNVINSTIVGGEGIPEPDSGVAAAAIDALGTATVTLTNTAIAFGGRRYRYGGEYGASSEAPSIQGRVLCQTAGAASIISGDGTFIQDSTCGKPADGDLGLSRLRESRDQLGYRAGTLRGGNNGGNLYFQFQVGALAYHTPLPGSPLIGGGDVTVCGSLPIKQIDERGRSRAGGECDSGAVEVSVGSITVNTVSDDSGSLTANCSLRDALAILGNEGGENGSGIRAAATCQQRYDTATVYFDPLVFPANGSTTISLSSELPFIRSTVTIQGPGQDNLAIDGTGTGYSLFRSFDAHLSLNNLTLQSGGEADGPEAGGVVARYSNLTISDSTVTGNSGRNSGGVSAIDSNVYLNRTTITDNYGGQNRAGGIYLSGPGLSIISDSTISGNQIEETSGALSNSDTGRQAGGLFIGQHHLAIVRNSTVSGNSSPRTGGGIGIRNGSLFLLNSTISDNTADVRGGGIHAQQFTGDKYKYDGINARTNSAYLVLINSIISGNHKGDGVNGMGVTEYGTEVTMSSLNAAGAPPFLPSVAQQMNRYLVNNVIGDDSRSYAEAVYSYSSPIESPQFNNSVIATTTTGGGSPNPASIPLERILRPLANNGGRTLTHGIPPNSPAIDGGETPFCEGNVFAPVTRDQRGFPRNDGACDIGSVEFDDGLCVAVRAVNTRTVTFCL